MRALMYSKSVTRLWTWINPCDSCVLHTNKATNESRSSWVIYEIHLGKSSPSLIFPFSHGSESKSRISDCVVKNSKKQNEGRCEGSKKERSQNGNSKKGNFFKKHFKDILRPSQKVFKMLFEKISFFGITILGSFLFRTFTPLILFFGIFASLHSTITDFLILTWGLGGGNHIGLGAMAIESEWSVS